MLSFIALLRSFIALLISFITLLLCSIFLLLSCIALVLVLSVIALYIRTQNPRLEQRINNFSILFSLYDFVEPAVHFHNFVLWCPHRGQPAAKCHPRWHPPGDWQSGVDWGETGYEPGTAGQQSGTLRLSHQPTTPPKF